jgi:hypothetical protein
MFLYAALAATLLAAPLVTIHAASDGGPAVSTPKDGGPGVVDPKDGGPGVTDPKDGGPGVTGGTTLANPLKFDSLEELLTAILKAAISLGEILLVFALIFTGFKFVAASGNDEKIRSAKSALMWTVIGGLILLGATAIMTVIQATVESVRP